MTVLRKIRSLLTTSQRKGAATLVVLILVSTALETIGMGLIIPLGALLTQSDLAARYPWAQQWLEYLGNPSPSQLVVAGMLIIVGVYAMKTLFLSFVASRQARFSWDVQAQLGQRLFASYLRQPYTFHLQRNSGPLIANVVKEVFTFGMAVTDGLNLVAEGLVVLCVIGLLLLIEPLGTAIVVAVMTPAAWLFHRVTSGRRSRWALARQYHDAQSYQHLQQGLNAAKDAKLLGRETEFLAQYGRHATELARVEQLRQVLQALPRLWLELLAVVGLATLVITMLTQGQSGAAIVPVLGVFSVAAFRLTPSAGRILSAINSLRHSLPAVDVLYEELRLEVLDQPVKRGACKPLQIGMDLVGVSYTYPDGPSPALNALSLTIAKGESVGFVGPSGAGKSTLVDIILGLLPPTTGRVEVDGRDIQQDLRGWQDQIGYVPQSVYLTDDTLRRNVAFGLPNDQIDEAAVSRAIIAAQLGEFVDSLPDGIETLVGENGVRLSGGQRQRIGIARALYHDPPVLVLDEATNALDVTTEQELMRAVEALQSGKTVLIVAHRMSTVAHCSTLCRLERGEIVSREIRGRPVERQPEGPQEMVRGD